MQRLLDTMKEPAYSPAMASREYHVNCIIKPEGENRHEAITHIGNNRANWITTRDAATKWIEAGEVNFYTADIATGKKMYLKVIRESAKEPYLRTHADGIENDNLLAQETCDANCRLIG